MIKLTPSHLPRLVIAPTVEDDHYHLLDILHRHQGNRSQGQRAEANLTDLPSMSRVSWATIMTYLEDMIRARGPSGVAGWEMAQTAIYEAARIKALLSLSDRVAARAEKWESPSDARQEEDSLETSLTMLLRDLMDLAHSLLRLTFVLTLSRIPPQVEPQTANTHQRHDEDLPRSLLR
jgi:hypothetical protein